MPKIYLSPSTQEFNPYINGGNEEKYMNLLADYMQPYLTASGIEFGRNTPDMTALTSIAASNDGDYELHFALHSNASPENLSGLIRGTDVYYFPGSSNGKRAAEIIASNFKWIYPDPDLVKPVPTTSIGEIRRTKAPAVLIEVAYHDNIDDANWIKNNLPDIAKNLSYSVAEYLGVPFIEPEPIYEGTVFISNGALNIHSKPSTKAPILAGIKNGEDVTILGEHDGWYVINYNDTTGYAKTEYIAI